MIIELRIRSGCWGTGELVLSGMPEDFILSNRKVLVVELSKYATTLAEVIQSDKIMSKERAGREMEVRLGRQILELRKKVCELDEEPARLVEMVRQQQVKIEQLMHGGEIANREIGRLKEKLKLKVRSWKLWRAK